MRKVLFVIIALSMFSCSDKEYDNRIFKDSKGDFYRAEHRVGNLYFIIKVNVAEIDSLRAISK